MSRNVLTTFGAEGVERVRRDIGDLQPQLQAVAVTLLWKLEGSLACQPCRDRAAIGHPPGDARAAHARKDVRVG